LRALRFPEKIRPQSKIFVRPDMAVACILVSGLEGVYELSA